MKLNACALALMVVIVYEVWRRSLGARIIFSDVLDWLAKNHRTRFRQPRFGKHLWVLHSHSIMKDVSLAGKAFDNVQFWTVYVPVFVKPSILAKIGYIYDERVSFPMADRIAIRHRVQVFVMRAAVGGNGAEDIIVFILHIEEIECLRSLHNLSRHADARNSLRLATKRRVEKLLAVEVIFNCCLILGFIGRP